MELRQNPIPSPCFNLIYHTTPSPTTSLITTPSSNPHQMEKHQHQRHKQHDPKNNSIGKPSVQQSSTIHITCHNIQRSIKLHHVSRIREELWGKYSRFTGIGSPAIVIWWADWPAKIRMRGTCQISRIKVIYLDHGPDRKFSGIVWFSRFPRFWVPVWRSGDVELWRSPNGRECAGDWVRKI